MRILRLFSLSMLCLGLVGCAAMGRRDRAETLLKPPPEAFHFEANPASADQALAGAKEVAPRSLETLRAMAAAGQSQTLGFASADEARSAALGDPVPVLTVRLDQLRDYREGSNPTALVNAVSAKVLYPVNVQQTVKSSILIAQTRGKWEAVSFGGRGLSTLLTRARQKNPAASFIVSVPGLKAHFAGSGRGADMSLTPLEDYSNLGLKAGETLPAAQVFSRLAGPAREHTGLPS